MIAHLALHVKGIADVLFLEQALLVVQRQGRRRRGVPIGDGGHEKDINGGVVTDGTLAGVGEIVEQLARGDGQEVWPEAVHGGHGDSDEQCDDGDDDEQFDEGESRGNDE